MPTPYRLSTLIEHINTELPDNTSQLISAEDVRVNIIESLQSIFDTVGDSGRSYAMTIDKDASSVGALYTNGDIIVNGNLQAGSIYNAGNEIINLSGGYIFDSTGVNTVRFNDRLLVDSSDVTSLDWGGRSLNDASGSISMGWDNRATYDSSGVQSIRWGSRGLNNSSDVPVLNWDDSTLLDAGSVLSVDWANRYLIDSGGSQYSIDWGNRQLINGFATATLDWNSTSLLDAIGDISADWDTRILIDSDSNTSADWENRILTDGTASTMLDWSGPLTTYANIVPGTSNTYTVGNSSQQFASLHSRGNYAYGSSSSTYVLTYCSSGVHPAMDFVEGGVRKLVFGYDTNADRATLYSDILGQGFHFYEGSGLAIGNDAGTYAGNQILINGASTSNAVIVRTSQAAAKVLTVRGTTSQTGNLLELQNSASTQVSAFNSAGKLILGSSAAPSATLDVFPQGNTDGINLRAAGSSNSLLQFYNNTSTLAGRIYCPQGGVDTGDLTNSLFLRSISNDVFIGRSGSTPPLRVSDVAVAIGGVAPVSTTALTVTQSTTANRVQRLSTTQAANGAVIEDTIQQKITTTNNTITHSTILTSATDTVYLVESTVIGRRTGGASGSANDSCSFKIAAHFRNDSGSLSKISDTVKTVIFRSSDLLDTDFNANSTNIRWQVTGLTSNDYTWHATHRIYPLST